MAEKVFTEEEVAQHSSASSCYFIIDGIVYDVTKFLTEVFFL
jgi:cytochrome b involved in lipid metabolism